MGSSGSVKSCVFVNIYFDRGLRVNMAQRRIRIPEQPIYVNKQNYVAKNDVR